ncbi:F-box domain-containing protein [Mycena venus]|uniref:F-box domain-containing protein n=1 Tax=Mycena venus TaxID=2733690 RepID=A0A8H6WYA1_9AGAR|nr:F-box domain-containing protein [Mycena venus]
MAATPFSVHAIILEQAERTSGSSKADIQRFIQESESRITVLELQITSLIERRDRERTTVAALRHLIAPIHTLPIELLAEIFNLTIRDDSHIKDTFLISHICSDWRRVAHSTPRLWTGRIRVNLECRDSEKVYADGLKAWLARSAPLPVSVSLTFRHWDKGRPVSSPISEEVLRVASRWRFLKLKMSHGIVPASLVRRIAECRLDELEELDLGEIEQDIPISDPTTLSFHTAPRLRKLRMTLDSGSLQVFVPWAQLTDLTLHCHPPDIVFDILAQCINIVNASFVTSGWFEVPHGNPDILALPHLHALSLKLYGRSGRFIPFLDRLSAPALKKLSLDFGETFTDDSEWIQANFTAFQLRSPDITQLNMSYSTLTSDDLRTVFRHASCLTHLKLVGCERCFDDDCIAALRYTDGTESLVPRLHHFVFDKTYAMAFTEHILVGMIASRWRTDAQVAAHLVPDVVARWTHVELRGNYKRKFKNMVEDLQRQGLPIQLRPGGG